MLTAGHGAMLIFVLGNILLPTTFVLRFKHFVPPNELRKTETVISNVRQQNPNSAIRQLMTNCKRNWQKAQKQRIVVENNLKWRKNN